MTANATINITPNFHTVQLLPDPFKSGTMALVINGSDPATGGNDTILVNPGPAKNSFQVIINGVAQPIFSGVTGRILVFGQDNGHDTITIGKSIKAQTLLVGGTGDDIITGGGGINFISGGPGHNTLNGGPGGKNTLLESGDFNMTLKSGTAKANGSLSGGAIDDVLIKTTFKNAQLTAGPSGDTLDASLFAGNTVLVGGAGNDTLLGGSAFNVLIGGNGADTLTGGKNSDLLIGGNTASDANVTALSQILAEWSSPIAYTTKIAHLLGTKFNGKNGAVLLNPSTITDDAMANTLTGRAGLDWFFQGAADTITDLNTGLPKPMETVTTLS
jgi:Ca2+-binding RTX toxin-like protein